MQQLKFSFNIPFTMLRSESKNRNIDVTATFDGCAIALQYSILDYIRRDIINIDTLSREISDLAIKRINEQVQISDSVVNEKGELCLN